MGALEYEPSQEIGLESKELDIDALTELASDILTEKESLHIKHNSNMMSQLMECSSSVGGARAKTLIAWNPLTDDVRSGQIDAGSGYEYWLLKFDNITNNKDKDATPDENEYTKVEYAYYLMAKSAGINMSECRLYKEKGSSHFMTKRFDRVGKNGEKIHMQTLCAIAHMDFNLPRTYTYEEAFDIMKKLKLPYKDFVELFRRMVFNDYAKNFDDHTKNISFLMDKRGVWSLSAAYDVTFAYKRGSIWVNAHQMLINGKSENITKEDLLAVAQNVGVKKQDAQKCINAVEAAVKNWELFAKEAGISKHNIKRIQSVIN